RVEIPVVAVPILAPVEGSVRAQRAAVVACDADRPVLPAARGAGHRSHPGAVVGDQRGGAAAAGAPRAARHARCRRAPAGCGTARAAPPLARDPDPAAGPAPAAVAATLPAISEPAPAPGPSAPAASGTTVTLPASAPIVAAKPPATTPEGVTRTARPQGGYQVRPAYPSGPRRLG